MMICIWFLINNVSNFFVAQNEFSELTVLIPGVTLTSSASITYFLCIPIVLVIHEGAWNCCSIEKIKIKTGGFAISIAMFAGFVEPDEEEFGKQKKISSFRVIGAWSNFKCNFCFFLGNITYKSFFE